MLNSQQTFGILVEKLDQDIKLIIFGLCTAVEKDIFLEHYDRMPPEEDKWDGLEADFEESVGVSQLGRIR